VGDGGGVELDAGDTAIGQQVEGRKDRSGMESHGDKGLEQTVSVTIGGDIRLEIHEVDSRAVLKGVDRMGSLAVGDVKEREGTKADSTNSASARGRDGEHGSSVREQLVEETGWDRVLVMVDEQHD
jgi:hypothetical protein